MSAVKQVIAINENEDTRADRMPVASGPVAAEIGGTSPESAVRPSRRRLPDERRAITHHFSIAGHEGYLTVGVYEDGSPGEIFIRMAKEGSTISGLMDSFATVVSLALQHGVPLEVLCGKFSHTRFEPSGWSGNPKIGFATSLMDYLFRWLELKFLKNEQGELFASRPLSIPSTLLPDGKGAVEALGELIQMGDAPACNICGSLMIRSGTCYRCMTCGSTSGCS
jgi:ribonucleoside-diphosphate reductase alpha chain